MRHWFAVLAAALAVFGAARVWPQSTGCSALSTSTFETRDSEGRVTWAVPEMECVEYFDIAVTTPHGVRHVRGIGDVNADTFLPRGGMAAIEAGARATVAKLAALGDYKLNDVVMLVTPVNAAPSERVATADGTVWKHNDIGGEASPEHGPGLGICPIKVYTFNWLSGTELQFVVAHEMFHCVQFASLAPDQIKFRSGWWIEGSAEGFAQYVVPHPSPRFDRAPRFRQNVEEQLPLFELIYNAQFFWLWYAERTGLSGLLPALRNAPTSADSASQMAYMRRLLADPQWLEFAQAFDDGKIHYPDGVAANFGEKVAGETWRFAETGAQRRTLKSFVIAPGWAEYECGVWANRQSPDPANLAVHTERERVWKPWPRETDCRTAGSIRYRTMAIHTGSANQTLAVNAERRIACTSCLSGPSRIDACMVGTWEQTGGGPMEYLRRHGFPVSRDNNGTVRMTIRSDGTFTSQAIGIDTQFRLPGRRGVTINDNVGRVNGTGGRWSAADGALRICFDSGGQARGTSVTQYPNGTIVQPFDTGGIAGESGSSRYTCHGDTMETRARTSLGDDMVHTFRRVSRR